MSEANSEPKGKGEKKTAIELDALNQEIIEKIRKEIGNDIVLSVKIDSENDENGGITEQGFLTACKLAEKAGVDMIQVTGFKWTREKPKNGSLLF